VKYNDSVSIFGNAASRMFTSERVYTVEPFGRWLSATWLTRRTRRISLPISKVKLQPVSHRDVHPRKPALSGIVWTETLWAIDMQAVVRIPSVLIIFWPILNSTYHDNANCNLCDLPLDLPNHESGASEVVVCRCTDGG